MAYKKPTSRKTKKKQEGLNLIPILDAVFIFIFFLLMSTQFVKIFEISSDIPIISNQEPPKDKKIPLALTISIKKDGFSVMTGVPATVVSTIKKVNDEYDLDSLHNFLYKLKTANLKEDDVILEPVADISYEEMIQIMDAVRLLKNTDDALFTKDKDGIDTQIRTLFNKIIFGNLMS